MKYAAIDIGSNAIRLLISDIIQVEGEIKPKKYSLIRVPLRLGDDSFLNQNLSTKKIEDLEKTIFAFKYLIEVYKVEDYKACATAAFRECINGASVIADIQEKTKINIQIIDGNEEAKMIYSTHLHQYRGQKRNLLYIDVGGGSTELSYFMNDVLIGSKSFNIGTIRMLDNEDKKEEWDAMKKWLKGYTQNIDNIEAIGTGGNINKLFKLSKEEEGIPITLTKLKGLYEYLSSYSLKDRINVLGLKQDRADVILPATEVFLSICKWAKIKKIHVPKTGLADGIIQSLIEKNLKTEF